MKQFDVIIIGGSYAGLSAAMALGRSLRTVLIIDGGKPCNRQTPHSHNFITQDGETPASISNKAREQVLKYPTVSIVNTIAIAATKHKAGFAIETESNEFFEGKKLLFATGITDLFPSIEGFADCWGISVLHCPYCHGYEVRHKAMGIIGNGDIGFEMCRLISNWSKQLILFTNGTSSLTQAQTDNLRRHGIIIIEDTIQTIQHSNGYIQNVVMNGGFAKKVEAIFARVPFVQHCLLPEQLGCELTEMGHIKVDDLNRTSIYGVYAAGDNSSMLRAVSNAVAAGTKAGAMINKELIEEEFQ